MKTYLKTKPVWMQMLLFLAIAGAGFVLAGSAGALILAKLTGINILALRNSSSWDFANPRMLTFMRGMIIIQFLFLFSIPSLVFAYLSDRKPFAYLGLKAPSSSIYWLLGILLLIVAYPFSEYAGYINQKISFSPSTQEWMKKMEEEASQQIRFMLSGHSVIELIRNLVYIALFAGIGEELFFRGILQRMFIRFFKNPWVGILITAAIFSAIHFQFYGFLPRMFLGVLLGAIYWYSGSLWVAMLVHFLYDASIIVLIYFNPQMLNDTNTTMLKGQEMQLLLFAMASLAVTFVILRQMEKRSVTSYDAIYNEDFPKSDTLSF